MSDMLLRKLLWLRHGCPSEYLYGDDGKMDCNCCMIDFVNDSPEKIQDRFNQIAEQRLQLQNLSPAELLAYLSRQAGTERRWSRRLSSRT